MGRLPDLCGTAGSGGRAIRILIVTPAPPGSRHGNRTTAQRWARILRKLGHRIDVRGTQDGGDADLLVALHARRSAAAVRRFRRERPDAPVVAALTGTDLYRDLGWSRGAQEVLEVSERLVALQPLALDEIPRRHRWKTHVILQSVPKPVGTVQRSRRTFDACVLGHLRAVKDPFRAAVASRQLPQDSRVRIVQVGGAHTPAMERRAREEARRNPRYRWLGELPRSRALRALRRSRVMVISSRMEGGANAISESLVSGVPVLASAIPGNVGLLGKGYPGYFPVGDSRALARLLRRAEIETAFLQRLESWCRRRARAFAPRREASAWRALLRELTRRS